MSKEFDILVESLGKSLPTLASQADDLRALVAEAESYGILISQYTRTLQSHLDEQRAEALGKLRELPVYAKLNAGEKKIYLESEVAELNAKLEYMEKLQDLIKRRVGLGQSFLKSFDKNN